jgi:hypothetical protein
VIQPVADDADVFQHRSFKTNGFLVRPTALKHGGALDQVRVGATAAARLLGGRRRRRQGGDKADLFKVLQKGERKPIEVQITKQVEAVDALRHGAHEKSARRRSGTLAGEHTAKETMVLLRHQFINRLHPCWHDVAENVVFGDVETKLEWRREYDGLVADLKDALETNAFSPNFPTLGCFARLADLAHGVQILFF